MSDNMPHELQALIPGNISECSLISAGKSTTCFPESILNYIIPGASQKPEVEQESIVEKLMEKTGCQDQRCLLLSDFIYDKIPATEIKQSLERDFKVGGPKDSSLLTNVNIDGVMKQWALHFKDFYPCRFSMRNHEEVQDELAKVKFQDLYNKGFRTFGCVLNTDTYDGRGIHWMGLFVDMRDKVWEICLYNSSGRLPPKEYDTWMVRRKIELEKIAPPGVKVVLAPMNRIPHQELDTECGVYSLFFIWAKLNKQMTEVFHKGKIRDKYMYEFRQHLFDDGKHPELNGVKKFNFDIYSDVFLAGKGK